jgi:hypothetical protein
MIKYLLTDNYLLIDAKGQRYKVTNMGHGCCYKIGEESTFTSLQDLTDKGSVFARIVMN